MKNIIFLAIAIFFTTTSCNKNKDTVNPSGIPEGTITCKINGSNYKCSVSESQINQVFVELFSIAGGTDVGNGEYETLALILDFSIGGTVTETTYNFEGIECYPTIEMCGMIVYGIRPPNEDLTHTSRAEGGFSEISFSSIDYRSGGHAIGAFSGKIMDEAGETINITDGKFNVAIK